MTTGVTLTGKPITLALHVITLHDLQDLIGRYDAAYSGSYEQPEIMHSLGETLAKLENELRRRKGFTRCRRCGLYNCEQGDTICGYCEMAAQQADEQRAERANEEALYGETSGYAIVIG